jgi:hypothetical protein
MPRLGECHWLLTFREHPFFWALRLISRSRQIKTVSAGAIFHVAFKWVEEPEAFLAALSSRKVATVPQPPALERCHDKAHLTHPASAGR